MANLRFPPPTDHQEFERLIYDIARAEWRGSSVNMNGRSGQRQDGVDISVTTFDDHMVGIQCKLTTGALKLGTVEQEVAKARQYLPPLDRYIVATTAPADVTLQEQVRLRRSQPFLVEIWSWAEINTFLNRLAPLGISYARQVILGMGSSDEIEQQHARYVRNSLDRAAFLQGGHAERSFVDQRTAVKDTTAFLATGYLYTREGKLVSQLPGSQYGELYGHELMAIKSALHRFDDHLGRHMKDLANPRSDQHVAVRIESDKRRLNVLTVANKMFRRLGLDELLPVS